MYAGRVVPVLQTFTRDYVTARSHNKIGGGGGGDRQKAMTERGGGGGVEGGGR